MAGTKSSGGRNAKSRAAHLVQGTFRKDRHANARHNDPPQGRPRRPKGLSVRARAEWTRMIARLDRARTLSTVDDAALYQYCCLFAETEEIHASRRENATLIKTLLQAIAQFEARAAADRGPVDVALDDGSDLADLVAQILTLKQLDAKQRTQLRQGHMAIRQYLVEFGMTPAARGRVTASASREPATTANPLDRFMKKKSKYW